MHLGGNRRVWYDNSGAMDEEVGDCARESSRGTAQRNKEQPGVLDKGLVYTSNTQTDDDVVHAKFNR